MNNEKDEDLAISDDGSMTSDGSTNIEVKTTNNTEPEVNEIETPPADSEVTSASTLETNSNEVKEEEKVLNSDVDDSAIGSEEVSTSPQSNTFSDTQATDQTETQQNKLDPVSATASLNAAEVTPNNNVSNNEQSLPHSEHRNNKKLAVLITVLAAALLAGAAIYVYLSAQDNTAEAPSQSEQSQVVDETNTPATAEDVDQAITEIDQSLDQIDSETNTNISEETVSDQNLGLN